MILSSMASATVASPIRRVDALQQAHHVAKVVGVVLQGLRHAFPNCLETRAGNHRRHSCRAQSTFAPSTCQQRCQVHAHSRHLGQPAGLAAGQPDRALEQLRQLKLLSMAQALELQMQQSGIAAMSFEERLALLVDREVHGRQDRRCAKLLKSAKLKYPQALIEDLDCRASRGLERVAVMSLTLGPWVRSGHAVLITGPTGVGKSWLACALAQHACRQGHSAYYQRVPRLAEELRIRHANGTFTRWLDALKNTDVLLLDDWGMAGMDGQTRTDLMEIIDDRATRRATIITSQLPIEHWHEWIATLARFIVDASNQMLATLAPAHLQKCYVIRIKSERSK